MMTSPYTVALAGTTTHTVLCAKALQVDPRFSLSWALTPGPKLIGRKQILTPNPVHIWAESIGLPTFHIEKKITPELQTLLPSRPDFLLVVDFGYLVPKWLLETPCVAPINIHPSRLPRWRGSSPGQFVLLFGTPDDRAVTIMIMGEGLDTGPILWQGDVIGLDETTSLAHYYEQSFTLAASKLGDVLQQVATGALTPQPQPTTSPTPIARRLERDDGFLCWNDFLLACGVQSHPDLTINLSTDQQTSELLRQAYRENGNSWANVLERATRALSPWPGVWTVTPEGQRMKILSISPSGDNPTVQLEGKTPTTWKAYRRTGKV